jgi:two-component system response regulator NreC
MPVLENANKFSAMGPLGAAVAPVPTIGRSVRVLVVDAHPLMRAGIRAVLASMPDVELVAEGATKEDALRLSRETQPDIVLVDIDGCDDSGLTVTRALTASDVHPRVIALTVLAEDESVVQALSAGASGLISKDASETDLVVALRVAAGDDVYVRPRSLALLAATVRRQLPSPEERAARAKYERLSIRERAVFEHVAAGLTGPEIGHLLRITAKTVATYRHRIREKIALVRRADYTRLALQIGLLKK